MLNEKDIRVINAALNKLLLTEKLKDVINEIKVKEILSVIEKVNKLPACQ